MTEHAGHHHGVSTDADRRHLWVALLLLLAFMVAEVVVAFAADSLALLSDAGHMLSDVGAIAGALWVMNLADGHHTTLDVAQRAGLPVAVVNEAATALEQADLLRRERSATTAGSSKR